MCADTREDSGCSRKGFMSVSLTLGPAILSIHYLFAVCPAGQVEALSSGASAQVRLWKHHPVVCWGLSCCPGPTVSPPGGLSPQQVVVGAQHRKPGDVPREPFGDKEAPAQGYLGLSVDCCLHFTCPPALGRHSIASGTRGEVSNPAIRCIPPECFLCRSLIGAVIMSERVII